MRKVDDYIKEKIKRNPDFKAHYDLLMEKTAVVKKLLNTVSDINYPRSNSPKNSV